MAPDPGRHPSGVIRAEVYAEAALPEARCQQVQHLALIRPVQANAAEASAEAFPVAPSLFTVTKERGPAVVGARYIVPGKHTWLLAHHPPRPHGRDFSHLFGSPRPASSL